MLYTLGYEGRGLEDVVALLEHHCIDLLIDVRATPRSRKPGLSKTRLAEAVGAVGTGYRHERRLGVPREERPAVRAGDDAALARYRRRLETEDGPAVERVVELARDQRVALLCFERDEATCHRRVVAALVTAHDPGIGHAVL